MTWESFPPYKQRTRQHVIADQSVNFLERFIIDEGHTVERQVKDYGYDLAMRTFDDDGYAEPGLAYFQIKASRLLRRDNSGYPFSVDARDFRLWISEPVPVFLVLYDAKERQGYWLCIKQYYLDNLDRFPQARTRTLRIHIPPANEINHDAIKRMREMKSRTRWKLRILGGE